MRCGSKQADASPTWPIKEGLCCHLWEGSQQTACTCQLLQGWPGAAEPPCQAHTLSGGQPASRDYDWRRYISGWLRTSGGIIRACRALCLYEQGFVETVSWLIFSLSSNLLSPVFLCTLSLFASGQPNVRQGDGASGMGRACQLDSGSGSPPWVVTFKERPQRRESMLCKDLEEQSFRQKGTARKFQREYTGTSILMGKQNFQMQAQDRGYDYSKLKSLCTGTALYHNQRLCDFNAWIAIQSTDQMKLFLSLLWPGMVHCSAEEML